MNRRFLPPGVAWRLGVVLSVSLAGCAVAAASASAADESHDQRLRLAASLYAQHQLEHRQAEASSDWIGIGGGCIDAGCTTTDSTLIQTGSEQDVSATGAPSGDCRQLLVAVGTAAGQGIRAPARARRHVLPLRARQDHIVARTHVWNVRHPVEG